MFERGNRVIYDFMHTIAYKNHSVDSSRVFLGGTEIVGRAWFTSPLAFYFFCSGILIPGSHSTGSGVKSQLLSVVQGSGYN
jgi:hypothetical protein